MVKVICLPWTLKTGGSGGPVTDPLTVHLVHLSPSRILLTSCSDPPAASLSGAGRLCSALPVTLLSFSPSCLPGSRSHRLCWWPLHSGLRLRSASGDTSGTWGIGRHRVHLSSGVPGTWESPGKERSCCCYNSLFLLFNFPYFYCILHLIFTRPGKL